MIENTDIEGLLREHGTRGVVLVCHQHLLPSAIPLFQYTLKHVALGRFTWVLGKPYSTMPLVVHQLDQLGIHVLGHTAGFLHGNYATGIREDLGTLWRHVEVSLESTDIERIILIDEGGFLAETIPDSLVSRAVAVEQTTFGTKSRTIRVPTVQVALSAAKRHFETPVISAAILDRLASLVADLERRSVGIIGTGPVGRRLSRDCLAAGLKVAVFDRRSAAMDDLGDAKVCRDVRELLHCSDVILGCTGADSVPPDALPKDRGLLFASASSADIEFNSLVRLVSDRPATLLGSLKVRVGNGPEHVILNGGFPINFDCRTEREPAAAMLLTRALMAAGIVQAIKSVEMKPGAYALDPVCQQEVVRRWAARTGLVQSAAIPTSVDWWVGMEGKAA